MVVALSKLATDRLHELQKHYRMQDYMAQMNLAKDTMQVLEVSAARLENHTARLRRQVAEEKKRRQLNASAKAEDVQPHGTST
ncbi:hypothetical protein IscW_ISCW022856 [Ixodes scapularis]|uniref:Uncharacterized protein n=1 Tax=Ixodes scapularis TaxID=6945 RepID=B7QC61_IXOSC|nr:hypothetical protein IscW_ISCW022856 [Ixodes scapularis]|eukprot:XP_002413124.1 hypothetical protein IscW_ISCW022856 [Ixodes scapularis]